MLEVKGYQIIEMACNGIEALKKYKSMERKPDLIILDHRMPGMNGIEVMVSLLSMNPKIKVLFASADNSVKDRALGLGAIGFLNKPFGMDDLFTELKEKLR